MSTAQKKALSNHRRRLKEQGFVRLEVQVRETDITLVREMARALSDPDRSVEMRTMLRDRLNVGRKKGLKELLVSAPLEGIDLTREKDYGREIEW